MLATPVDKTVLIDRLGQFWRHIRRAQKAIEILSKSNVPITIRVATVPEGISFDFAIIEDGKPLLLIELHEKQHRTLSVTRPALIYDEYGRPVEVPRFVQRIIRDVWRLQVTRTYSVDPNVALEFVYAA
jgi:hypothetical protein